MISKRLCNPFEKIANALKCVANAFANVFKGNDDLPKLPSYHLTRYTCNKCGSRLIISGHTSSEIIYTCGGCGKIHKAKKGKVFGRF